MQLLLITAYVLVTLLLLNMGLRSRWHWGLKLIAIVLCSLFYVFTWQGLKQIQGWPSDQELPEKFRLIAYHIIEPDKQGDDHGEIYLWAIDMTDTGQRPRAYRLPYSVAMHDKLLGAGKRQKQGKPQQGIRQAAPEDSGGTTQDPPQPQTIHFEDIPRPMLPEK